MRPLAPPTDRAGAAEACLLKARPRQRGPGRAVLPKDVLDSLVIEMETMKDDLEDKDIE